MRLEKLVADGAGVSRSDAKELIKSGRVQLLDGEVFLDGKRLEAEEHLYLMLNKPEGFVCATEDKREKTVLELLGEGLSRKELFPVGRLDKDTTGLLILTSDGAFAHAVTHPKKHIFKEYELFTAEPMTAADSEAILGGIELRDGTRCRKAALSIDPEDAKHGWLRLSEGKYHQVKRMLAARGNRVEKLKRISIGGLELDAALMPGQFRLMSREQAEKVFETCGEN
ncbi:MAG: 16S rRNA pseudouridine(516) synthase [Oscillospiraceae bacterium]|jgi:16S rRNA pseudouridine516 synthase|nr:16S rRNA pseudouridine(516) synthase [Oscillospiraceae bacterium]